MEDENDLVFISYAREDLTSAERLYMDLRKQDINAWLDMKCLAAGANWKYEIKRAIRDSRYFILLLSKHSITKRGFVQNELKEAINVLQEFPKDQIFLIPVRLDKTEPVDDELLDLNWVELSPNYHDGFSKIMSSLSNAARDPLKITTAGESPVTTTFTITDKGRDIDVEMPAIIGKRAAVNYAPFRTQVEFLQQFFDRLPSDSVFADRTLSYYITISTIDDNVLIGDDLKKEYPEYITLVLQNSYRELVAAETGFSVILSFGNKLRTIAIPYDSIRQIQVRELGITITFEELTEEDI